jgi:hypothetical protein
MRRIYKLSMAAFALASACSDPKGTILNPVGPTASVRFINAVTDTGGTTGLDFRFVDIVENNAQAGILFRNSPVSGDAPAWIGSTKIEYKPAAAGTRYFKIFLSDPTQSVASTVINTTTLPIDAGSNTVMPNDTTLVLAAGKNYTVIVWGEARTGSANPIHIAAWEEGVADPAANVALRVLNTTPGVINATAVDNTTTATVATWTGIPAYSASAYVTTPPASITYNITGFATLSGLAMPGQPAKASSGGGTVDLPAVPGTSIAGSAVTAIVWPRSVAGATTVPQTTTAPVSFQAPLMTFMWDRRPPKGCSDVIC